MADESARACAGKHHGADARIPVDPVYQLLELVGDIEAEQAVRAAVDPHDQHLSAVLDLEMSLGFVSHEISPS